MDQSLGDLSRPLVVKVWNCHQKLVLSSLAKLDRLEYTTQRERYFTAQVYEKTFLYMGDPHTLIVEVIWMKIGELELTLEDQA
ncbi:hypothetical protein J6590_087363 [Homalodisca vitripennis]|nr:hypothetical protein J6590_087363 [Homalodisca vitripennis]